MQYVEEQHWLPYSPQTIYDFLAEPKSLASVVGRIVDAKVLEREGDKGRLAVVLDLPARKFVETEGHAIGTPYRQLTFTTGEPFPLEFTWKLTPHEQEGQTGTAITSVLGFDFSAFGLPMVGMIVSSLISSEIREDLQRLEQQLAKLYQKPPL